MWVACRPTISSARPRSNGWPARTPPDTAPPAMWRLILTAALAVAGLWALSQLTVATWLAREATQREAGWAQGISPWQWDFSDPASIVRGGSHGIDHARHYSGELWLSAPDDGVVNLSLPLRGERID